MKRIICFYTTLFIVLFAGNTVSGQITDTISISWEELPQPQKGIFTQYFAKTDTLFAIRPDPYEVWQSSDKGLVWSLYRSDLLEFVATDSFIFYKKKYPLPAGGFQTRLERRDNAGAILEMTPSDNSIFQYSNNGLSYSSVTETKIIPFTTESTFALYTVSRQIICGPGGCGTSAIYYRQLRLSTDAGASFQQFHLPHFGTYDELPFFDVKGDSLVILDNGHVYIVPKKSTDLWTVNSLADSLPQKKITWTGNCIHIWDFDRSLFRKPSFRVKSFNGGVTWMKDTLSPQLDRAEVTRRDTFTFLACPGGLYRSVNIHADNFVRIYEGIPGAGPTIQSLLPLLPDIYANSNNNMLLHSTDNGQSWTLGNVPMVKDKTVVSMVLDDELNLLSQSSWYRLPADSSQWRVKESQLPGNGTFRKPVLRHGGLLWSGGNYSNVLKSADEGKSWESSIIDSFYHDREVHLSVADNQLFADVDVRRWMTKDSGTTWQSWLGWHNPARQVKLGDTIVYTINFLNELYQTTDFGQTFKLVLQSPESVIGLYQMPDGKILTVLKNGVTYVSEDRGDSWVQTGLPLPGPNNNNRSVVTDSLLFFLASNGNLPPLFSGNNGVRYVAFNFPLPYIWGNQLIPNKGYLYFLTSERVFRTSLDTIRNENLWKYVTTVSSPEINNPEISDFALFPNPTHSQVSISLGNRLTTKYLSISVLNPQGIILKEMKIPETADEKISFDLSSLPAGIYFIGVKVISGQVLFKKMTLFK